MKKFELIQYLLLFFVVVTIINYGLHMKIMEQDEHIQSKAIDFINHYCKLTQVNQAGMEYVFNESYKVHDFTGLEGVPVEQQGHTH